MKHLLHATLSVLSLAVPVAAQEGRWAPTEITGFARNGSAATWSENCSTRLPDSIAIAGADMKKIENAALNDELSCVRFGYQGKSYFVREISITHTGSRAVSASVCDKVKAEGATAKLGATQTGVMGNGAAANRNDCPTARRVGR
jgi:hypothetical protein